MSKINADWLKQRTEQIAQQKEQNSKFVSLKNGENKIGIDLNNLPEPQNTKFGVRMVYTTTTKKGEKSLLLSASIVLDSLIVKALSAGINPFTLIKVGEGKETRYAIKELEIN